MSAQGERVRPGNPAVSVVVPSYQGAGTIGATLRSLAAQTLPQDQFEIIIVQNGEPDHTAKVIAEVCGEHPGLVVRRLECLTPGAGRARNAGLAMARGAYTAFVDDDDTVSPRYLEALLQCSSPNTVGVAQAADVLDSDVAPDFGNRLATQLVLADRVVPPRGAVSAMTYTWGKLLPTALARAVGFDPHLRSGEDIVFYLRFFLRFPLQMRCVPLDSHAVYYRAVVPGSLSRQPCSYDFNVTQRLDVIECLESLQPDEVWQRSAVRARTVAQTKRINEFLRSTPDQLPFVLRDICQRGLVTVPMSVMLNSIYDAAPSSGSVASSSPDRSSVGAGLSMAG